MESFQAGCVAIAHQKFGACFMCCEQCAAESHKCNQCGDEVTHNGLDPDVMAPHPCLAMIRKDDL